jgi:hypothetical protein
LPDLFARHDCRTNFKDHAGYHAHRLPPARPVWIPAAQLTSSWRTVETTRPALVGKAAMLSMTRPQAYEISIHARIYPGGNRKDRTGFAGDTLQEQDTFYSMPFHLTQLVIA